MPHLSDFIELGEAFFHLRNPQVANVDSYANDVGKFLRLLRECGMQRTLTASRTLDGTSIPRLTNQGIPAAAIAQLHTLANSIANTLYDEANTRQIMVLHGEPIADSLLNLPSTLGVTSLEPHQEALRQDVMLCLRVGAFRPAIVVAWALTFDLLRQWIFSNADRLTEFNAVLQRRTQKDGARQIVLFADFFEEKESFVLDICRDAHGVLAPFTTKTHRQLQSLLDDRNAFAHANYNNATEAEAKAFIDHCIRLLTGSPFR